MWGPGSRPDSFKLQKPGVEKRADRVQVSDGGDAANGKTSLRADQCGIGFSQGLPGDRAGLCCIDAVATGGQKQQRGIAGLAAEDDGLCDLIEVASCDIRRLLGGAGIGAGFHDPRCDSSGLEGGAYAFQTLAHANRCASSNRGLQVPVDLSTWLISSCPMTFETRITRWPLPHQPDIGAEIAERWSDVPEPLRLLITGAAGSSPYLAGLIGKEEAWLRDSLAHGPDLAVDAEVAAVPECQLAELPRRMRRAKGRIALLTGLCDLGGVWSLEQVTSVLTRLADQVCDTGLKALMRQAFERGRLPFLKEDDLADAGGFSILAMGKMGAAELNYSSDIDLICLFDETRFAAEDYPEIRSAYVKITRGLTAMLSDVTEDGYVFRTDLRLRPDASVTPVCIAMEAAERYYESVGRNWERAAFIKARACAGDIGAGTRFLERLTPFIWRRHLDFASIQDAHDMRLRIREHKGLHGDALAGRDLKLGRGGIREIEFFTQTRQIIAGGRDPDLRVRGTVEGLARLADAGWVEADVRDQLTAAYRAHREVEHRLQMIADAQTHALPKTPEGFARLTALMGREDVEELQDEMVARLGTVARLTEPFFAPGDVNETTVDVSDYLSQWRAFLALRTDRAVEIFRRLFPVILGELQNAANPDEAIGQFETFLAGLPAGVQVFSLFDANPELARLIADICATSPALASYLSRNAGVFDAVIGGDFFTEWPGVQDLRDDLAEALDRVEDYEAQLDEARRWQKEWRFRIGVHHLRGLITPEQAGAQYADVAEAVIASLVPKVAAQFALKHGAAPGRGAAVLAMGSLGARQLNAKSDLDLIVIYDADGVEQSDGKRPLMTVPYFARFTQMLVTALTAPTAEGKLYEVDLRLRPSGRAGPVAVGLNGFEHYQKNEAWVWEHLALTRARVIAGRADLAEDIEAIRARVLEGGHPADKVVAETQEMRVRLKEAGRVGAGWESKEGPGGQKDIELLAQAACVVAGRTSRQTSEQLALCVELGWLTTGQVDLLRAAHLLFRRVQATARLITDQALDPQLIGAGATTVLLRDCDCETLDSLAARLAECREQAKKLVDLVLLNGDAHGSRETTE